LPIKSRAAKALASDAFGLVHDLVYLLEEVVLESRAKKRIPIRDRADIELPGVNRKSTRAVSTNWGQKKTSSIRSVKVGTQNPKVNADPGGHNDTEVCSTASLKRKGTDDAHKGKKENV